MGLGGANLDEKVSLLIAYLRKMNDELNIPHGIKNYGADSYPVVQGFVPENVIPGIVIQIYCKYNTTMIYYPI